jgi:hypothetical protein
MDSKNYNPNLVRSPRTHRLKVDLNNSPKASLNNNLTPNYKQKPVYSKAHSFDIGPESHSHRVYEEP